MTGDAQTDLPKGWQRCGLPDFAVIVMGQSPPSETYNHDKKGLPFFQGKKGFGDLYPTINMHCSQARKDRQARGNSLVSSSPCRT